MLVGIMADSHDNVPLIRMAVALFRQRGVEAILHAGDVVAPFSAKELREFGGPVFCVYGNNDGERAGLAKILDIQPSPRRLTVGGRAVVIAHDAGDVTDEVAAGADLVVVGHTHEAATVEGAPLTVNPGETGGWLGGRPTCMVMDLDNLAGELCDLVRS